MPDSLQRVNPILADVPEGRGWDGNSQDRKARRNRGDRRELEASVSPLAEDEDDLLESPSLLDVRI